MKSIFRDLLVFLGIVSIFISGIAQAGIIHVDANNTAGPWDGTQEHPYQHIQDAIGLIDTFPVEGGGTSASTVIVGAPSPIEVSIPEITALAGSDVVVHINVSDTTGEGVIGITIVLTYDPDILTAVDISLDNTITSEWIAFGNPDDGQIIIGMISATPLNGSGTLVKVNFSVSGTANPGETSPLTLAEASFNEGGVSTTTTNGTFVVDDPPPSQLIQLHPGRNLISTYIIAEDNDLVSVLGPIEGSYRAVWAYYTNPGWKRYIYGGDDTANNLEDIVPGVGYCIDMTEEATLTIAGEQVTDTDIPLVAGWNFVGYNFPTEEDINTALASIMDVLDSIYTYDDESEDWLIYTTNGPEPLNDLTTLKPGKAYWINVRENRLWAILP